MEWTSEFTIETPRFGAFARQMFGVPQKCIEQCINEQCRGNDPNDARSDERGRQAERGRLGAMLVRRDLLEEQQVFEILNRQAEWVARLYTSEMGEERLPYSRPFSLCMPCYNEQSVLDDWLRSVVAILPVFADEFEVIVVDDGSHDRTADIVRQVSSQEPRVRLIQHEVNKGYGAAVATALRAAEGELICLVDGDGQFNLLDLPRLLTGVAQADVVLGYRMMRADTRIRKWNAAGWNRLVRTLLGVKVIDLDCAFKLFPRWAVEQFQLESEGACISAEILVQCARGGLTIHEVPVNHHPRYSGEATGANLRVVLKAFRELPNLMKYRSSPPIQRLVAGAPSGDAAGENVVAPAVLAPARSS